MLWWSTKSCTNTGTTFHLLCRYERRNSSLLVSPGTSSRDCKASSIPVHLAGWRCTILNWTNSKSECTSMRNGGSSRWIRDADAVLVRPNDSGVHRAQIMPMGKPVMHNTAIAVKASKESGEPLGTTRIQARTPRLRCHSVVEISMDLIRQTPVQVSAIGTRHSPPQSVTSGLRVLRIPRVLTMIVIEAERDVEASTTFRNF